MAKECPRCRTKNPLENAFCLSCGYSFSGKAVTTETLETPTELLARGSIFAGRYEIIEALGIGGMGQVYRVFDSNIQEEVALKIIKPEIASNKRTLERFRNELKIARKITHKNVCRLHDLNVEGEALFLTMEYVRGEDLKSFIRRTKQLAISTAVSVGQQIAGGLAEAHRLGIVHRDLKPDNIMIDKNGQAKIMDFGIAQTSKSKGITQIGMTIGTPEYMSPEQVEGAQIDKHTDIYSLGIILYEMVTGVLPFTGDTPSVVGAKHRSEIPVNPRELNTQVPEALSRIILKCMAKNKEQRYHSVEEIRADLEKIGKPITDRKSPIGWKNSIAVLPFTNLSDDKEQEYFCDGIAEEIINTLAHVEDLRVVARTSAFAFKNKNVNVIEIGKELRADTILEGSVRKSGNRIRLLAQLIDVENGFHLWSEKYDREMNDVFAVQDEITQAIFNHLKIKLLGKNKKTLAKRYGGISNSYVLYLKGRYFWNKRTEEALRKSIECFKEGIKQEPSSALYYAGLSDAYHSLGYYNFIPGKDIYKKALAAAERALEIDENLGEAYASLGCIRLFYDWDLSGAEDALKKAIHFNPNYASAHHWLAFYLAARGRHDEAWLEMKRALDLDPLSVVISAAAAWILYLAGNYSRAEEQCRNSIELDPNYHVSHLVRGLVFLQEKMYLEALSEFQKARELITDDAGTITYIGIAHARSGNIEETKKMMLELKNLSETKYVPPYYEAAISAVLGEKREAIEQLKKAYSERTPWLVFIHLWPIFENLHDEPGFRSLLKSIGNFTPAQVIPE